MEIEGDYAPFGMQIDGKIRRKYEEGFENLKQTDSYAGGLRAIATMFEALGESRPVDGRGMVWGRDMIEAYRTVGKLFTRYIGRGQKFGIEELTEDHLNLLRDLGGDTDKERIYSALQDLTEIYEIFRNYEVKDKTELKEELEKLKELREGSESLSELEDLAADVEDFEDNFA